MYLYNLFLFFSASFIQLSLAVNRPFFLQLRKTVLSFLKVTATVHGKKYTVKSSNEKKHTK